MNRGCILRAMVMPTLALGAAFSFSPSAVAQPEGQRAAATASTTIVQPVGAGVAFDVSTKVLTAVFLSGQRGEQLSLLLPGRRQGGTLQSSAVQTFASRDGIVVLSTGTVSIDVGTMSAGPGRTDRNGGTNTMLVIAQFN